ncbi:MAG TPA: TrmH family RNA methyltransferase, partial [Sulfuricaulis sp.]
ARRLVAGAGKGPVALLFGQERTGLLNEELDRCHAMVTIPADKDYSSLNLASAVQILAYELFRASLVEIVTSKATGRHEGLPVNQEDMHRFYEHLEKVLHQVRFLDPDNPRLLMRRLMRLFNRAELDDNELNILRGILTAIQKHHDKS